MFVNYESQFGEDEAEDELEDDEPAARSSCGRSAPVGNILEQQLLCMFVFVCVGFFFGFCGALLHLVRISGKVQ